MSEQPPRRGPDVDDVETLLVEAFSRSHATVVDMGAVTAAARRRGRVLRRRRQVSAVVAAGVMLVAAVGVGTQMGRLVRAVHEPAQRTPSPSHSASVHKPAFGGVVDYSSCPAPPGNGDAMPPETSTFLVVGLYGPTTTGVNPCLSMEVDWARTRGRTVQFESMAVPVALAELTAQAGAVDEAALIAQAQTAGRQRGRTMVTTLRDRQLTPTMVWLWVGPQPYTPWPTGKQGKAINSALVQGMIAGVEEMGPTAGIATTTMTWSTVTGNARMPSVPVWLSPAPTGHPDETTACQTASPLGGPVYLITWSNSQTDGNVVLGCPTNPTINP